MRIRNKKNKMKKLYRGVKIHFHNDGKIIIEEFGLDNTMIKETEVDIKKLRDGSCKILETKKGRLAICKEEDKIKVYPIDED